MLCNRLGEWARKTGEQVHVVFDGPSPAPDLAAQIGHPDIKTSYSGSGISADAVVIEIIETDPAIRHMTVVSTDREILRAAKRRRARAIRSVDFWVGVTNDLARPPEPRMEPEEKETGLTSDATDAWLEEFGFSE
jgi:hypothetical protein